MGAGEEGGGMREGDDRRPPRKRYVQKHTELEAYKIGFATAMRIFELSKTFPAEERYSLTDQIRRSSRSVCANVTEGWRKRRYPAAFVSKMNDAEGEAAETQTWLHFAVDCGYVPPQIGRELYEAEESVIRLLVAMQNDPHRWTGPR